MRVEPSPPNGMWPIYSIPEAIVLIEPLTELSCLARTSAGARLLATYRLLLPQIKQSHIIHPFSRDFHGFLTECHQAVYTIHLYHIARTSA